MSVFFASTISNLSPSSKAKIEQTHVLLTPFKYFQWNAEMVIKLRSKGLHRDTMGTKVEPNYSMEKSKHFKRLNEAFRIICLCISRDLLFYVNSMTTPNEVWLNIEALFRNTNEMRGHQLENELISLSQPHY